MRVRVKTRISLEGWYYLAIILFIAGGAALGEVNLLLALTGMLVGPLLFNWRFVQLTLRRVDVSRRLPWRINAGDVFTVAIAARNQRRRLTSWTLVVEDRVARIGGADERRPHQVRLVVPRVDPGQSCTVQYRLQPRQRGRYRFGPVRVSTRFPLGLIRGSFKNPETHFLLVYPPLGHLTTNWVQLVNSRSLGSHNEGRRQGGLDGDYYGLREWRDGDSQRWIHWRTSAKLGELAVRQFEQQRNNDLTLLLDLWQPETPSQPDLDTTELAISFAATVVTSLCKRGGSRLTLGIVGAPPRQWNGPATAMLAEEILDHLALAGPTSAVTPQQALNHFPTLGSADTATVVISTRSDPFANPVAAPQYESQSGGRPFPPGRFQWIDCRGDELQQYFFPPQKPAEAFGERRA